jgi:hypothetical protein
MNRSRGGHVKITPSPDTGRSGATDRAAHAFETEWSWCYSSTTDLILDDSRATRFSTEWCIEPVAASPLDEIERTEPSREDAILRPTRVHSIPNSATRRRP